MSPLVRAWIEFAAICLIASILPSVRNALWRIQLSDKVFAVMFPVRNLLGKKIKHKNDFARLVFDVRVDGSVNAIAVIWYVFAYLAALALLIGGFFVSEATLSVFLDVVLYFFLLCMIPLAIGIFTGDRKDCYRVRVEEADPEVLHGHEEAIAHEIEEAIREDQAAMQALGYRWRIDILCTDRLDDKPIQSASGMFAAFTGTPQTNPIYMSRAVATILDENDEAVVFPIKRRNEIDIAYTQNSNVTVYHADYIVRNISGLVHDVTVIMSEADR